MSPDRRDPPTAAPAHHELADDLDELEGCTCHESATLHAHGYYPATAADDDLELLLIPEGDQ